MIFDNVICGVDATPEGEVAAEVAARVTTPDGRLLLLSVEDPYAAAQAGWGASALLALLDEQAGKALERGRSATATVHAVETRSVVGHPGTCLLDEIRGRDASLVVVGSHERSRAVGIALGSVATLLVHEAPCSVLIARAPRIPSSWPRSIVAGIDGSEGSAAAYEVARALARRFGADVRAMVATLDRHEGEETLAQIAPDVEHHDARAVDMLAVASEFADLVVVGSRGLHGLAALGSVSERVAHEARSPVLVVRDVPAV